MMGKKERGSYYTPAFLSKFIVEYLNSNSVLRSDLNILEPSVGDGSFIEPLDDLIFKSNYKNVKITGVEKIKPEIEKAKLRIKYGNKGSYNFIHSDFLKYQKDAPRVFDLIIGNPPYIKKSYLNQIQIDLCSKIHASENLSSATIKNIWTSFLIRGIQLLNKTGVLVYILPAEILQVKFTEELRTLLQSKFERIEIFTFQSLLFNSIGQDTIILFGFKKALNKGLFYTKIENENDLSEKTFVLTQNVGLTNTKTKWSHHVLSSDQIEFLYRLKSKCQLVKDFCTSKPGVVTAANKFFIVNEEVEKQFGLSPYTEPIIQKGLFVNGSVQFDVKDYEEIVAFGYPSKLINLNNFNKTDLSDQAKAYLEIGIENKIHKRYKCQKRKKWFQIPNISKSTEGFFFKRTHLYPKLIKNNTNVLVTDSAYKIEMIAGYSIESLIASFYNSLTLVFSEMDGRYYGGGVLELTPNEFKNLPLPYQAIDIDEFIIYANEFKNKENISAITKKYDQRFLKASLALTDDDIKLLQEIKGKLYDKRLKR